MNQRTAFSLGIAVRHLRTACLGLLIVPLVSAIAGAEPWQRSDPTTSGWSTSQLAIARQEVAKLGATGFVIIRDGKMIASWGDISRKVNVASVRKSLLSALVGIAAAEGKIRLDATLADLAIDERAPGLTPGEKQAKVIDLLKARSGVYHPAAYELPGVTPPKPARGSVAPGANWHYNNWDANALGTIYRETTGEDIFVSFGKRIAEPVGMEDFSTLDGRHVTEAVSNHPAYPFLMSARDLARFGQLYLDDGRWEGKQIIPAEWIRDSLTSHSETDRRDRGYGYMWWILDPAIFGPGAGIAVGNGGQFIAVVPSKRLVVTETVERQPGARGIGTGDFIAILRWIASAAP